MAILSKGHTFANLDDVTSTKLNDLVDAATFVTGASGSTDDSSLEVNGSGRLQVKDAGISAAKLAAGAVVTSKLPASTGATDGVTYAKIQYVANMRALGNTSGSLAAPAEIPILDEDNMASDSATSLATQQSIKAYVDAEVTTATTDLTGITYGTEVATTSGTAINFTGIPSTVKRITIMLVGVSTNGSSSFLVRIGDSGGVENTGYISCQSSTGANSANATAFEITDSTSSGNVHSGMVILTRVSASSSTWTSISNISRYNNGAVYSQAGYKTLSGTLDRVQLTTTSADTFDAGSVNICYE